MSGFSAFQAKMEAEGLSQAAIKAFEYSYSSLVSGESGMMTEASIQNVDDIPYLEGRAGCIHENIKADSSLLQKTVVLKLNGGLGTSMGLDKVKSLLNIKGTDTFLDMTAKQIMEMRKKYNSNVRFILMNSFSTSTDTLDYLQKYPDIVSDVELELLQNKVPKIDVATMQPATWKINSSKEWCPPGHGDLYPSLLGSGKLDKLLAQGYKYMFVSNSDNLGATLDLELLTYFAQKDTAFMMECCERTENDKKGGHLAKRIADGRLVLRESAQCEAADEAEFQNIAKHRYFNTNNLWIRLDKLAEELHKQGGLIKLPMIRNSKTVDPKDSSSPAVYQLETAMGAAIECFDNATAVCVPRTRFAPVKKCDDLLLLRSDAYVVTDDYRLVLAPECNGTATLMSLDSKKFKLVQQLEAALRGNVPSLIRCHRLKVTGDVGFAPDVILEGDITIVNNSKEQKTVLSGTYRNQTIDVTNQPGLGKLTVSTVSTHPIDGQKPGTSGLRKKTKVFMENNYLNNFVQSTFDALPAKDLIGGTLVVSGDGRYFNKEAIQIIIKMAVASGVDRIWVGQNGLLSTPAISAVIREREGGAVAFGAFILTASHNPGGIHEDFGIKYNCENGGPAPEKVTDEIYHNTKAITSYKIAHDFPHVDVTRVGATAVKSDDGSRTVVVEVFDAAEDHVDLLKTIFDFKAIKSLISREDFSFVYDCMSGVQGPYARRVFIEELGAPESSLINAVPLEDFGGHHADPNLTYATELTHIMGVDAKGMPIHGQSHKVPSFGAACDGDADRNMILGSRFFVTPSDSLAVIAANANVIPFFRKKGGLRGVARSMPTSGAVDLVAKKLGISLFEVPTGWKFFGNLMDSKEVYGKEDYTPFICGEESFGTGSNHIREKDGMWAVLSWLSILAAKNTPGQPLVGVEDIVVNHWKTYGRNYYCRYDYEGVDKVAAEKMMAAMASAKKAGETLNGFTVKFNDEFTYHDPVDGSISRNQGIRFIFTDGSRIIFRLSGTGVAGATIRMYIEKYEPATGNLAQSAAEALRPLIDAGLALSALQSYTGRSEPTVIT
ncbi:phosphoglucomutase [Thraustotheca clavata]|uniref:Phosphoglucomutase n=1 Tax=Thraustotheca clavata TaxID=74557 RepID=A0A1W0A3N2_9STRA|nr:phosphoglucomutase [Thraustotheca clavata]